MMLAFVATEDHQYTFRDVFETRVHAFRGRVILLSYRDFLSWPRLPLADYVFVDLERLPLPLLLAAEARFARLQAAAPGLRALNPPSPALGRLEVMRRLHAAGINRFRVEPASARELETPLRFPLFLRRIDDHEGPMSALLEDEAALAGALAKAAADGIPANALVVTEYVDARNADGYHEKLSYFRIDRGLFPSALDMSRNWVCKGVVGDPDTVENYAREQAFLTGNPHAALLEPAFDAAGIDYGRADYAMVDGRPQIFEINTNPLIDAPEAMPAALRPYAELLVTRWLEMLATYSPPRDRGRRWVAVPGAVPVAAAGGHHLRRTVRALLGAVGHLHNETRAMRPLRLAKIAR